MLGWLLSLFCQPSKPVNTRDEALNIAQTAIRQKWPNYHNSEDEPSLWYDEKLGVWHFRYFTQNAHLLFFNLDYLMELSLH